MSATPTEQRDRLLTMPFALAFAANFLTSLCAHAYLHLPGYLHQLGARELLIGVVMGSMSAAGILARPFLGRWMDDRGRRAPAIVGALCMIAACLSYLFVDSIGPFLFAVRIAHGIAVAALFSSLFTIAADVSPPERRAGAIALFGVSGLIPIAIGGLVGDIILATGSYRTLFWFTAIAAVLILLFVLPIRDTRPTPIPSVDAPGFFRSVSGAGLRPLWFVAFGFALCVSATFTFLKTYVLQTGIGTVGTFFASYSVAAVGIRLTTSRLLDRIGAKQALIPSLVLTCGGLVSLAIASNPTSLIVAGALCGLGHGYAFPTIAAMVVHRTDASNRGLAITMFTALFDVGFLVGGPAFGALIRVSSYPTMFVTAAVLLSLTTIVFLMWDRAHVAIAVPEESRGPG